MANLSQEPAISAGTEDMKFLQASSVNVSYFVSVRLMLLHQRLSSKSNYQIWKAQMICLMESQMMHGIVDAKHRKPGVKNVHIIKQYDNLLKGWIFGSLDDQEVLKQVVGLESAQDVWEKLKSLYEPIITTTVHRIKNVEKKKKEYKEAKKILTFICDQIYMLDYSRVHALCSGPLLEAVRQNAYEVVDEILLRSPNAIDYKNQEGQNVIQLAIINRSAEVYNLIYHRIKRNESYRTMVDFSKNNLVHLVGRLAPPLVLDRTTGAALQLQQELQWREEVEKLMLPTERIEKNMYMETPEMVFTREHADLVKEGEKWMKTTAESCSITAALIVTIVFAAAITVPGGSNQETGIPLFKKEIAFTIFAVSDAISLFAAATALLLFLSILTTRFSEKDFLFSLPIRMIIGLCVLFLSTTAMMVAFSAILVLVFCDQRPWMFAPIGLFACSPIAVIVTLQFPLVVDLFLSTYSPIFGKQSYLDSCKTNPNNVGFTHQTSLSRW